MKFNIRGENIEVTPAIREYVEKKIGKIERFFIKSNGANVYVSLRVNHDKTVKVEVTIPLQYLVLRAEENDSDMYAAIDFILDKLERQIRKHKTKVNRKFHKRNGNATTFITNVEIASSNKEQEEEELEVVRTKQFDLKPMDNEEAILQMNMIGHSFYVFTNADTNRTNIVYKRKDGRYGVIEAL